MSYIAGVNSGEKATLDDLCDMIEEAPGDEVERFAALVNRLCVFSNTTNVAEAVRSGATNDWNKRHAKGAFKGI